VTRGRRENLLRIESGEVHRKRKKQKVFEKTSTAGHEKGGEGWPCETTGAWS